MPEIVKCPIHASFLALPLRVGFRGKVERYLPYRLRKSHSEFAARVVIAEQSISNGSSSMNAGKPGFNNSRYVLINPIDAQRPPVYENHYHTRAGSATCLHQPQSATRRRNPARRRAFTRRRD